jgi:hypothetical protein
VHQQAATLLRRRLCSSNTPEALQMELRPSLQVSDRRCLGPVASCPPRLLAPQPKPRACLGVQAQVCALLQP